MGSPPKDPIATPSAGTHRVGVLAELPAVLRERVVDPRAVLAAAGVAPALLSDPENRMPFRDVGRLLDEAVAATGCAHLGVLVGLRGGLGSLGLVGRLMATAPTVRDAVLDLCVNQVRFIEGAVTYFTVQGGIGLWGYAVQAPPLRGIAAILDAAVGIGVRVIGELCGLRPEQARLAHAAPGDRNAFRTALGVPCVFDAEQTCLVLPPEILAAPVRGADPALRRRLQRQVADYWARTQPPIAEQARRALAAHVTAGTPTLEALAVALGLTPRTLNRRLQAEGTSFRAVRDQTRHDVACQLLRTTRMPVTEIGMALGYATPPGFVRAFRRSAGLAPSGWRRARVPAPAGQA
jgi:AraC-like DNA-binding protein